MKYEDFISRFEKRRKTQQGIITSCPAHDDNPKTPSLSISPGRNGEILLKCFAGCTAQAVIGSLGLTFKDLFPDKGYVAFTPPVRHEQPAKAGPEEKPVIEKIYSYQSHLGVELYQALRMKPKSFRQRHKVGGDWVWNMDGVERVLFRLPKILAAQQVWIVEGEKDADNLVALGFEATCNVGGAGKWLDSYSETMESKDVVICGDNDDPGRKHVELVFNSISAVAKSVRILKLPVPFKDASDYIESFKETSEARSALQDLVSAAHPTVKGHNMPVYSIGELEDDYRRFVRSMGVNAFSLGKWLPTLGINLRPLVPGELVFFIGDTGTGKTMILSQIARAAMPLPTIFFEMELPKEMMFERYASMLSRMTGDEIERAYQSSDDSIAALVESKVPNLLICPVARLTVKQIEEIVCRSELKLGERPRVVLIDYIQIIKADGPNRREKVSDIAEQLKIMAKETRTIVIVASQISRPQNPDEDWEPGLHSGKESGSIESSCGLLISAWQDAKEAATLNLRVLKSTKGGTGTFVKCNFDGPRMIITERSKFHDDEPRKQHND